MFVLIFLRESQLAKKSKMMSPGLRPPLAIRPSLTYICYSRSGYNPMFCDIFILIYVCLCVCLFVYFIIFQLYRPLYQGFEKIDSKIAFLKEAETTLYCHPTPNFCQVNNNAITKRYWSLHKSLELGGSKLCFNRRINCNVWVELFRNPALYINVNNR